MSVDPVPLVAAVLLFILVFILGFRLRRSGKPFSGLVLTTHKLLSLAVLVIFVLTVYRANSAQPLETAALAAALLAGVFFVTAILSGGLASTEKPTPRVALVLHRVTPFLTVVCAAATVLMLP